MNLELSELHINEIVRSEGYEKAKAALNKNKQGILNGLKNATSQPVRRALGIQLKRNSDLFNMVIANQAKSLIGVKEDE